MKTQLKKGLLLVAILSLFMVDLKAQATSSAKKGFISIGPELGLTVGRLNDRYSTSLGASVQLDAYLSDQLFLIGNIGYTNFFLQSDAPSGINDLQLMPIKAGIKVFPTDNFYLQGSLGANFLLNRTKAGYDEKAAFVYVPQIGFQFKVGKADMVDTGINFQGNTKFSSNGKSNNLFALRLAYGFGL